MEDAVKRQKTESIASLRPVNRDIWRRLIVPRMDIRDVLNLAEVLPVVGQIAKEDSFWKEKFAWDFPDLAELWAGLPEWIVPGDRRATSYRNLPWLRYCLVARPVMRHVTRKVLGLFLGEGALLSRRDGPVASIAAYSDLRTVVLSDGREMTVWEAVEEFFPADLATRTGNRSMAGTNLFQIFISAFKFLSEKFPTNISSQFTIVTDKKVEDAMFLLSLKDYFLVSVKSLQMNVALNFTKWLFTKKDYSFWLPPLQEEALQVPSHQFRIRFLAFTSPKEGREILDVLTKAGREFIRDDGGAVFLGNRGGGMEPSPKRARAITLSKAVAELADEVRTSGKDVPPEIWEKILLELDENDALAAAQVFPQAAFFVYGDDTFWRRKFFADFPDLEEFVGSKLPSWVQSWRRYYFVVYPIMRYIARKVLRLCSVEGFDGYSYPLQDLVEETTVQAHVVLYTGIRNVSFYESMLNKRLETATVWQVVRRYLYDPLAPGIRRLQGTRTMAQTNLLRLFVTGYQILGATTDTIYGFGAFMVARTSQYKYTRFYAPPKADEEQKETAKAALNFVRWVMSLHAGDRSIWFRGEGVYYALRAQLERQFEVAEEKGEKGEKYLRQLAAACAVCGAVRGEDTVACSVCAGFFFCGEECGRAHLDTVHDE